MKILDIVVIVLLVMWLGGFAFNIAGSLVHFLLLVAGIVYIVRLLT